LLDAMLMDIETNGRQLFAEFDGERQPDLAESNDGETG